MSTMMLRRQDDDRLFFSETCETFWWSIEPFLFRQSAVRHSSNVMLKVLLQSWSDF